MNMKRDTSRRISLYLSDLDEGGAENVMVILANEFANRGFDVEFVLAKAVGGFIGRLSSRVKILDLRVPNKFLSLLSLIKYFQNNPSTIVLSTLHVNNIMVILAKKISMAKNIRVVVRVATTVSAQRRVYWKKVVEKFVLSIIYPHADAVIAVSKVVAEDLVDYIGLNKEMIYPIYNPTITSELLIKSKKELSHPWFQPGMPPVVLGVGRLTIDKGYADLVRALAIINKIHEVNLVILGDGDQRHNLEMLAKELAIETKIEIMGFVDNPFNFMRNATVMVLPSLWEGLPNVLIEGLACHCQIISTDSPGGVREILDNGKYGFLVPVGDPKAIAEQIQQVLNGNHLVVEPDWLKQFDVQKATDLYLRAMGV